MKAFTVGCLIVAFLFFMAVPVVLDHRPAVNAPREVRKTFAIKLELTIGIPVLALVGAGVGSALVMRKARQEYREQALINMQMLVETARSLKSEPHE
jgi:hypothetical protein